MRQLVLLRGVNLAGRNRLPMAELRGLLSGVGFDDVRTYLQSGNVLVSSDKSPQQLARTCKQEIASHFGLDLEVLVRTRAELAEVVRRNPLEGIAADPKRYLVSFLAKKPPSELVRKLADSATSEERLVGFGRELYSWHPGGIGRSRLWTLLAGQSLGITATARNWNTVTKLLALARSDK